MQPVLEAAIADALAELGVTEPPAFSVEHPADTTYGDYATNVAMVAFKSFTQAVDSHVGEINWVVKPGHFFANPRELAEAIKTRLTDQIEYVDRIEVAGPGFINFYLTRDFFQAATKRINVLEREKVGQWGRNNTQSDEVVLFEYTSPNLFKPLHIGNLVGNIIGESISRLFEYSGAVVRRCNYPSDIGLTVAKGVWGLQKTNADPSDINAIGEAYRTGNTAYESGEAKEEIETINRSLYAGTNAALNSLREAGIATSRKQLTKLCEMLGTYFDTEITESMATEPGLETVRKYVGKVFEESDGAVVYKGEKVGLHTRVFINSQGLPTYEAKDVGHHILKTAKHPDWTTSVIVTGSEQREYFKVLFAALREINPHIQPAQLEHISTGFLTLTTGKMSSRKGNVLTGESLLSEVITAAITKIQDDVHIANPTLATQVAVAAVKYQILKQGAGSDIVFDKEKSLSFEGDSGPYLQYTYARIVSVLEKAAAAGVSPSVSVVPETPYELEKILYRFEEVIEAAFTERAPHKVAGYLTELASTFNSFYAVEKIADATDPGAAYKAALATAVGHTLKNGLWVLGIEAPDRL